MTQQLTPDMMAEAMGMGLPSALPTPSALPAGEEPIDEDIPAVLSNEMMEEALKSPHKDITTEMRFNIGLIKEDPRLQVEYLKRKGVDAYLSDDDQVIVDGRPFRGSEFSFQDFAEWIPEIIEGGADAVLTGTKVMGALGAPATGGASIAAASAVGGLVTGGLETARQSMAIGRGLRPELDPGRILKKAAIGAAVPAAVSGLGKVIGSGLHKAGILEAAEEIGTKATPAMLAEPGSVVGKAQAFAESGLEKQGMGVFGIPLRVKRQKQREAANQAAEEILSLKSERSGLEVGEQFAEEVKRSVQAKLKPAEELYSEVSEKLGDIPVDRDVLWDALKKLEKRMKFSKEGTFTIRGIESKIGDIKTLEDLKLFRTSIRDEIPGTAPKNVKAVVDDMYQAATKARSDSFKAFIKEKQKDFNNPPEGEAYDMWSKELQRRYDSLSADDRNKIVSSFNGNKRPDGMAVADLTEKQANRKINEFGSWNERDYWHTELGEGLDVLRQRAIQEKPELFNQTLQGFMAKDPFGNLLASKPKQKAILNLKDKFKANEKADEGLLEKIEKADKLYAETADLVQKALMTRGKKMKLGVRQQASKTIEDVIPEQRGKKFLKRDDATKSAALKELSPEGFETLRKDVMSDIYNKSLTKARGGFQQINPQKVASEIDKMSPEVAKQIFGEAAIKKKRALQKFYGALPGDINPSGTGSFPTTAALIGQQISTAGLASLNALLSASSNEAVRKTALYLTLSKGLETRGDKFKPAPGNEKQIINRRGK